jgi:hypothetical protein
MFEKNMDSYVSGVKVSRHSGSSAVSGRLVIRIRLCNVLAVGLI